MFGAYHQCANVADEELVSLAKETPKLQEDLPK